MAYRSAKEGQKRRRVAVLDIKQYNFAIDRLPKKIDMDGEGFQLLRIS